MGWIKKPVLVTGASGVIGSALVQELRDNGYEHVIAANTADADLLNFDSTVDLIRRTKPSLVFHLAARVFGIMGNMKNKGPVFYENVLINTNVIEACRLADVKKVVAMGSTAIYSDQADLPMSEGQIWRGPPHPSEEAYAHAKRTMYAHLQAYQDSYGLDYAFCISTNLYGPYDKFDERFGHVVPSLVSKFQRSAQSGEPVYVWGTGAPERDFLYSKDAALALRLVGEQFSGAINIASGRPVRITSLVEILQRISGGKTEVIWDTTKPDGQNKRDYDITKLKNLGFEPRHSLEQGLRETYKWYLDNFSSARR